VEAFRRFEPSETGRIIAVARLYGVESDERWQVRRGGGRLIGTGKEALNERVAGLLDVASRIPADDPRRRAASIAMFDQVAQHWGLDGEERQTLLGGVTKSTWSDWKQRAFSARIRPDTRERIANLYAIDLMTHSIFAPEFADAWIRRANASFGDESAIAVMLGGKIEDIVFVRRYLESVGSGSAPAPQSPKPSKEKSERAIRPALETAIAGLEKLFEHEPERYAMTLLFALDALENFLLGIDDRDAAELVGQRWSEVREVVQPKPTVGGTATGGVSTKAGAE
jgi:hypothetical protein